VGSSPISHPKIPGYSANKSFRGFILPALNETMNGLLFFIPLIAAFIGWLTNKLAIKMLFHPVQPKRILGITIQGVFPKRQKLFAENLGKLVSKEFLSFADIELKISDPGNLQKIMPMIEKHVDEFLRVKMSDEMPFLSLFIGEKTINSLKKIFMQEIELLFPRVMKQYAADLKQELDLEHIVTQKVAALSSDKLEELLHRIMSKEFRFVEWVGAIIGFLIGLLQVAITLWIK
jgi:uncharacterized membrane protein YheB (UPF0754 family)